MPAKVRARSSLAAESSLVRWKFNKAEKVPGLASPVTRLFPRVNVCVSNTNASAIRGRLVKGHAVDLDKA